MPKWIVTSTNTWEVEAETGPAAIDMVERDPVGLGGGLPEYSAETEDGEQPCEGCGKPATCADIEGVPLCKECMDAMLNEPDTYGEDPLGGSWS